jgi:hypothetical protein
MQAISRLLIMMAIRYRINYALTVLVIIILGIASRKVSNQLPFFIADNSGDVLWAGMVYFGFRCLFTIKSLQWAFGASLIFSFLIEFSQLYQADWINVIRHTTLGALILGKGFLIVDLIRYFIGITISYLADLFALKHAPGRSLKL